MPKSSGNAEGRSGDGALPEKDASASGAGDEPKEDESRSPARADLAAKPLRL
jgi:hypothetical protein